MTQDEKITLVAHVLHGLGNRATSTEIAEYALSREFRPHAIGHQFDLIGVSDPLVLSGQITRAVKKHIQGTSPLNQVIVGTKTGGWNLGPAASRVLMLSHRDLLRPADAQYTGLVGEYAVMSELLACDWNVAKLPHDDGVDLIATKNRQLRTVQVKTAHATRDNNYAFTVSKRAHQQHDSISHYYVLVLRVMQVGRYLNDFLILNSQDMHALDIKGCLVSLGEKDWRMTVKVAEGRVHIGDTDLSDRLNRFRSLFM